VFDGSILRIGKACVEDARHTDETLWRAVVPLPRRHVDGSPVLVAVTVQQANEDQVVKRRPDLALLQLGFLHHLSAVSASVTYGKQDALHVGWLLKGKGLAFANRHPSISLACNLNTHAERAADDKSAIQTWHYLCALHGCAENVLPLILGELLPVPIDLAGDVFHHCPQASVLSH